MSSQEQFAVGVFIMSLSGVFVSIQGGSNSTLGASVGGSFASLVSFVSALLAILCYFMVDVLALGQQLPTKASLQCLPWWSWIGGVLGAFYVASTIIFARILGSGILTSVFVTGQLCTAVVLDAKGWFGFSKRQFQWQRVLGLCLMIAGVLLIALFRGDAVLDNSAGTLPSSNVNQPSASNKAVENDDQQ
ncbi:hypothetical protein CEUSTIGMA_g9781.t1 [Chlamydomonas eustigma]|uniref:EamA domain-containing protein n=1 Tax=Chlamydomonas eustigma TaxID=1157962 RepID=A0A250XHE9_9CHLO|nr:hypothetical protein CEUSTIGMA_g9781.t1 [Chlamydomonas eustigma]|eukprot:GAX82352.1 hypothetical protein CEUSTIGMA_g9781.t1 [Chlamydomonas eustigma]